MTFTIGIITIILGLIGWVGQTLAVFNNDLATKLGIREHGKESTMKIAADVIVGLVAAHFYAA